MKKQRSSGWREVFRGKILWNDSGVPWKRWLAHPKLVFHSVAELLLAYGSGNPAGGEGKNKIKCVRLEYSILHSLAPEVQEATATAELNMVSIEIDPRWKNVGWDARSAALGSHLFRYAVELAGQRANHCGHNQLILALTKHQSTNEDLYILIQCAYIGSKCSLAPLYMSD